MKETKKLELIPAYGFVFGYMMLLVIRRKRTVIFIEPVIT